MMQTVRVPYISTSFSNGIAQALGTEWFEYHTFLHHSQTNACAMPALVSLSTIHFYIILKPLISSRSSDPGLSTIHFYIILKLLISSRSSDPGLSTIHFYIILKLHSRHQRTYNSLSTIHFYIILKLRSMI